MTAAEKISKDSFFSFLYGEVPEKNFIEMRYTLAQGFGESKIFSVWGKTGGLAEWLKGTDEAFRRLPHNIHFTPAPRNEPSGKKTAVSLIPALWTDIDNMSGEAEENLYGELESLDLTPNLAVSSGWGTYLFWVLEKPSLDLMRSEEMNRAAALLTGGDTGAVNISHTLRSPGSFNCKTSVPRPVVPFLLREKRYPEKELYGRIGECASLYQEYLAASESKKTPSVRYIEDKGARGEFPLLETPVWKDVGTVRCPLLNTALRSPDMLSYSGWMSLGGALRMVCGETEGEKAFTSLSRLSSIKYSSSGCIRTWKNICEKNMRAWNCAKTGEGAYCPESGSCKGIVSVLYQIMPRKEKTKKGED